MGCAGAVVLAGLPASKPCALYSGEALAPMGRVGAAAGDAAGRISAGLAAGTVNFAAGFGGGGGMDWRDDRLATAAMAMGMVRSSVRGEGVGGPRRWR